MPMIRRRHRVLRVGTMLTVAMLAGPVIAALFGGFRPLASAASLTAQRRMPSPRDTTLPLLEWEDPAIYEVNREPARARESMTQST